MKLMPAMRLSFYCALISSENLAIQLQRTLGNNFRSALRIPYVFKNRSYACSSYLFTSLTVHYFALSVVYILSTNDGRPPTYIDLGCIGRLHYVEENYRAFGTVEMDVGCNKGKVISQMDGVEGFVRGDDSVALPSTGLFEN